MGCRGHAQFPLGYRLRHGGGYRTLLRDRFAPVCIGGSSLHHRNVRCHGVRYETGEQAKLLNRMFTEWMDQSRTELPFLGGKKLKEMVGHTPIEVLTGAALGVALGFAMPMV